MHNTLILKLFVIFLTKTSVLTLYEAVLPFITKSNPTTPGAHLKHQASFAFEYFENKHIPVEQIFSQIDNTVKQCGLYGFEVIIDYHNDNFNENNYLSETPWQQLFHFYRRTFY